MPASQSCLSEIFHPSRENCEDELRGLTFLPTPVLWFPTRRWSLLHLPTPLLSPGSLFGALYSCPFQPHQNRRLLATGFPRWEGSCHQHPTAPGMQPGPAGPAGQARSSTPPSSHPRGHPYLQRPSECGCTWTRRSSQLASGPGDWGAGR